MKLHHVQLAIPADSEDKCRDFYCKLLGLVELEKPADLAARGGLWLQSEGYEIHLGVEDEFRAAKKAHPAFMINDIDTLAHRLDGAGHTVDWDGTIAGLRRFFVHDPVGNRIEFMQQ